MTKAFKFTGATILAAALAACSAGPSRVQNARPALPTKGSEIDVALELLMNGDEKGAQKQLKTVLRRDPMNADARLLSDSISRDPKDLLGPQSYPYIARAGDTVVGLAQRFLGSRLKAYQLLRYNGLNAPALLSAGQIVQIPGELPRVEPVRRPEASSSRPSPAAAAPKPRSLPTKTTASMTNAVAAHPTNPTAARQLRGAGLAELNQGNIARAVGLLRRAAALDPANPMIAHDLARAERIAATVKARR